MMACLHSFIRAILGLFYFTKKCWNKTILSFKIEMMIIWYWWEWRRRKKKKMQTIFINKKNIHVGKSISRQHRCKRVKRIMILRECKCNPLSIWKWTLIKIIGVASSSSVKFENGALWMSEESSSVTSKMIVFEPIWFHFFLSFNLFKSKKENFFWL